MAEDEQRKRCRIAPAQESLVGTEVIDEIVEFLHLDSLAFRLTVTPVIEGSHGKSSLNQIGCECGVAATVFGIAVNNQDHTASGRVFGSPLLEEDLITADSGEVPAGVFNVG